MQFFRRLRHFILVLSFLLLAFQNVFAEGSFVGKQILSFDLKGVYHSSKTNTAGWGFGVSLERQIFPFLSIRAETEHSALRHLTNNDRAYTVALGAAPLYYPFCRGLDRLYFGCGIYTEFLMYKGDNVPSSHDKDTLIALVPRIGWKQNLFDYVMLDIFCAYNVEISDTNIPDFAGGLVKDGFEVGLKVKLNIPLLWRTIFKRRS